MPTTDRVPFTVTIDGTQLELVTRDAAVDVFPKDRDEFITTLRGIATIPGATAPVSRIGIAAVIIAGGVKFRVFAPAELRNTIDLTPLSPKLEAALIDAVAEVVP